MGTDSRGLNPPHWGAEVEILLGCARTRMDEAVADRVRRALKQTIDWSYVMRQAAFHGVIPLLFKHLNHFFVDDVPRTVLESLRSSSNGITFRNLALTGELLKLLKLFQQQGVRALPLKGPALAVCAYGNPSLRQFGDLDILVAKDDMLKGKDVLISQGYHAKYKLTAVQEAEYLKSHHDYQFFRRSDGLVVDLQRGVTERSFAFAFDFADAWNHRETISVSGSPVFNIAPEMLLVILCVHGTKHRWEQLKWLCDIAELVEARRDSIDWPRLMSQARSLGSERMLLLGLLLAHDLLGAFIPDEIETTIANNVSVKSLARQIAQALFVEKRQKNLLMELEEGPFFLWSVRERWRDRAAIAWKYVPRFYRRFFVPNENDARFLKLPRSLSLGYYLVHPVRLLTVYWSESRRRATDGRKRVKH